MNMNDLFTEVWNLKNAADTRRDVLAERYAQAWGFYKGTYPERTKPSDLPARKIMWQAFQSMYPSLVAIFTDAQKSPVNFDSDNDQKGNAALAQAVTTAIHNAALKSNGAYKMYLKAIKEILIAGDQAALVGIGSDTVTTDKHNFTDLPAGQLLAITKMIMSGGYNVEQEVTLDEDNQTVTGWIKGAKEIKYPVIKLIDFKDYYLDPEAIDADESDYQAYAERVTKGECKQRKYKATATDNGSDIDTNDGRSTDKALVVVGDLNADDIANRPDSVLSDNNDIITVWHHFWHGCYNESKASWHYVVTNEAEVLFHKAIDYCPMFKGGMDIINGSGWSESLYDACKSSQTSTTRALRAIQRSADNAAYGEYQYVESQMDARGKAALADRRPGACYPVKAANTISKLPVTDIPNAMSLLNQQLNDDADKTIQGSTGNAQALEENSGASGTAIALTQNKQELNENQIAKTIAETFIKPMYKRLLLVCQEIDKPFLFEGNHMPLKLVSKDMGLSIDVETEYDRTNAAQNLMNVLNAGTQAGTIPQNITPDNAYAIYKLYFQAVTGQEDVSQFITATEDMPQPSKPEQIMKAVMAVAQLRSQIAETKLAEAKVDNMTADTQKKYNDAAKDLASIDQILAEIDLGKLQLALDSFKAQNEAASKTTQDAQGQEKIDAQ